nr:Ribonucleoside-diphosphate reductase large subunit [Ipomoea batatas]GME11629.1 Ribonucleoside-diphosphate reductase large subunit [Ipomoea batatas]
MVENKAHDYAVDNWTHLRQKAIRIPLEGAFAVYLEPWHADIFEFLDLRKNKAKKVVQAQNLWFKILKSQIEIGTSCGLYKDSCKKQKSNQQNLAIIY